MQDHRTATDGMVDYRNNSAMQQRLVHHQADRIAQLAAGLGKAGQEFSLADYGCGPGQSAIDAVVPAIRAHHQRFPDAPVLVCHADQPGNDWNGLFRLTTGPTGYAAPSIRTTAAIGSFYDRLLSDGSVDLATCFMASHWLSQPAELVAPGTIWFTDLPDTERAALGAEARADWIRFLNHRARELRGGGALLVSCLGAVPDAREIHGRAASGRGVYRAIQLVAQGMVDDGLIARDVLDRFVFGLWFMTEQEALEPLRTDPGLKDAFMVEEVSVAPAPVSPTDVFAGAIGDPVEYARLYTGYIRGFAQSSLHAQLFEPGAHGEWTASQLADEFYRRLDTLYRTEPGRHAGETWYLTVQLRRK